MKVFIVVEGVDLGYHIQSVQAVESVANQIAEAKNKEYLSLYGKSGKTQWFWVEEREVEGTQ